MRLFNLPAFTYRVYSVVAACRLLQLAWLFIMCYSVGSALAQTSPITTSGLNTQINLSATPPAGKVQYDITGGTRPGDGANLFHSFGEFGLPTHSVANFLNELGLPTSNILGRVTGGNISNIFGAIQTEGFGNANLFLINPAGFLFGPNATVNVGGMVAFTSADYLKLTDNAQFNAIPNAAADALLTALPVASFGFLGSNPGAITVLGSQFSVTDGQSISLVGGNITIQSGTLENGLSQPARLSAPNGEIRLASARSPGEFLIGRLQPAPNIDGATFASSGSVRLAQNSIVDVSGTGTVFIRGGQFVLEVSNAVLSTSRNSSSGIDNIVLNNGSAITAATTGPGNAGSVIVTAESIALVDSSINSTSFDSGGGAGNGGLIWLHAPSIKLQHGNLLSLSQGPGNAGNILLEGNTIAIGSNSGGIESSVSSETSRSGRGGDITMRGLNGSSSRAGDVTISGESSVTSTTSGQGRAGDIDVMTERMALTDGGAMMTSGTGGHAGNMKIDAGESVQISSFSSLESSAFDTGNAGNITVITPTMTVTGGGVISTSTEASGNAGTITINATSVNLLNGGQLKSSSLNFATPESPELAPTGSAGNVTIEGAQRSAQSVLVDGPGSGIFTNTQGSGVGGNIFVNANSVTLQNGGTISAATSGTDALATGGSITLTAFQSVDLRSKASISAESIGDADAGNILINAGNRFEAGNSSVTTKSNRAGGGNIEINALDQIRLVNSQVNASAFLDGGNISIDPNVVTLQNSQILAQAVQGAGGNIAIFTPLFVADSTSLVSASSQFGLNGTVTIQSPTSNLSESLGALPSEPSQAQTLLTQRC
ncbi:MAG: filamentous hemagglutinin N-terminal domain-containing protein, partial [Nitrospirota bacterium]|nr:filamentous hemagglutinin N-terminal domain-containing protein [Nitrospirota bacterium]